jgi:calmodulin
VKHEAKAMSNQEINRIRQKFDSFDTDSNGLIDLQEFLDMIDVLYPGTSASYLEGGFVLMDQNHDGYIDFQEFLGWWREEDWGD